MENRQYYILDKKVKKGPYSLEDLKSLPVSEDTLVWYAGVGEWAPAASIMEIENNVVLLRPRKSLKRVGILIASVLLVLLTIGVFWSKQLFGKKEPIKKLPTLSLNNQQLYNRYSSGVVLIHHKFIYAVHIDDRRYYFNELYDEGDIYLGGLTEDSALAVKRSEPIQGTGFFISDDGKLLTNRHVAVGNPTAVQNRGIRSAIIQALSSQSENNHWEDSVQRQKLQYDSLLTELRTDTLTNAARIADIQQKISETEELLIMEEEGDFVPLKTDSLIIDAVSNGEIEVKKITLDLRIFTSGTTEIEQSAGIPCTIQATSEDEEVDLALLQTNSRQLPDTAIKVFKLSRVKAILEGKQEPQMSERLLLIGYNKGEWLGNTSDGIKAQLTEGKISQNTDGYKLMYTIPTLPGSSGSPVFDEKGQLVAVNFAGLTSTQSFNYGIQPKQVGRFLKAHGVKL